MKLDRINGRELSVWDDGATTGQENEDARVLKRYQEIKVFL